jgi:hypothetical protein
VGLREEALTAAQDAVDIRRRLAETNPAALEPDFAKSLWARFITRSAADKMHAARLRSPWWGGAIHSKVELVHIAAALKGEVGAIFAGDGDLGSNEAKIAQFL